MLSALLDGLSLVDTAGHLILATTLACLLLGVSANLILRARYAALERDLKQNPGGNQPFAHRVLNAIVRDVQDAARRSREANTQAIIEDNFQAELKPLLLAERFVKASTGLAIILGLLGTFYGLTLSIGRLVHLVSADTGGATDISQALTTGLTQALAGMAVAFSNSLVGIVSAVILTVVGVVSNVSDRRIALMIQAETYVDRNVAPRALGAGAANLDRSVAAFGESVARLERVVAHVEGALDALSANTRDLREFNVRIVASSPKGTP